MKMKQNKTLKDNLNDRKMRNKRDRQWRNKTRKLNRMRIEK